MKTFAGLYHNALKLHVLVSSLFLLLFEPLMSMDWISAGVFLLRAERATRMCRMFGVARGNCCCLSRAAEVHCKSARARSGLRRFYSSGHWLTICGYQELRCDFNESREAS